MNILVFSSQTNIHTQNHGIFLHYMRENLYMMGVNPIYQRHSTQIQGNILTLTGDERSNYWAHHSRKFVSELKKKTSPRNGAPIPQSL